MSALEEYRKGTSHLANCERYDRGPHRVKHLADAAIAELEAENKALRITLAAAQGTGAPIACPRCGGAASIWVEPAPGSSIAGYRTSCPGCGGRGWVR
jgi:hypothetical protein